jgi:cytoskeletal protein CcmA (bactofilin family)
MPYKLPLLFAAVLLSAQAHALQFISTNTYEVARSATLADEQWVYTIDANVSGTVQDDLLLLAGNRMTLDGTFERNLWGLGGTVSMTGNARHNVRLAGKTVQIGGAVGGNVLGFGDTVKISPEASIEGGMKLMGNSIIVEGITKGKVSITASRVVTLSGRFDGDVDIIAPEIILQRNTRIGGNLTYTAGKELIPAEGIIAGRIERAIPRTAPTFSRERMVSRLMWFLAALIAGVPFITLFPMTTAMASQLVRTMPWKCLWIGALCTLALPIFGIMSISSVIGIPLGALLLGGWAFMVYTSRIIIALVLGTIMLRPGSTSIGRVLLSMIIGLAIIYAAGSIPMISWSVQIVVVCMGMGALLLGLFQKRRLIIQVPEELKHIEELRKQEHQHEEKSP